MRNENLIGKKYSRLTVIEKVGSNKKGEMQWLCKCECGNPKITTTSKLKSGHTKSCGCYYYETRKIINKTHGKTKTKLYKIYRSIIDRTEYKSSKSYKNYGGRGIKMCEEWRNDFETFYNWAINNGYGEGLTIDRIDVNGDYEPSNCRWVDRITQANNKTNNHYITFNGQNKTMAQWSKDLNIPYSTLNRRLNQYKWSIERALNG